MRLWFKAIHLIVTKTAMFCYCLQNPYVLSADPCGSNSGSAISVASNLVAVALGTETDGSILCPASFNSVVGIKPTVGLTSRAGVIPVSPRQDTIGYVIFKDCRYNIYPTNFCSSILYGCMQPMSHNMWGPHVCDPHQLWDISCMKPMYKIILPNSTFSISRTRMIHCLNYHLVVNM